MGTNPPGYWAFILLPLFSPSHTTVVSYIRSLVEVNLYLRKFKKWIPSCAALGKTGFISLE